MLCHSVERGNKHTSSFTTFHLAHLPGELFLYALADERMVGIDDVSQKINTLGYREDTLVIFYLESDAFHALVNDVPDSLQFLFGRGKNGTIITVSIIVRHSETVFKNVIEVNRQ